MSVILHDGEGLPLNGTTGQILTQTDAGTAWQNKPTYTASEVGAAASSHTHSAEDITSGTLALAQGGTGKNTAPLGLYALINGSTALTSTGIATGDYIPVGDISAATGKKITLANLKTALGVDSSGGGVVVGTYTGNKESANASETLQAQQSISLGFQPKFVLVGELSLDVPAWYRDCDTDELGNYTDDTRMYAGWAMPNYPLICYHGVDSGDSCRLLEVTSTGFAVRNARMADSGSTWTDRGVYSLNVSGTTYFYLAVK